MDDRAFLSATGLHFRRQPARSMRPEIEINLINAMSDARWRWRLGAGATHGSYWA